MKKSITLILLFLLSACGSVVYFDLPQPENKKALKTVPDELTGKWIDNDETNEDDTIYITKNGKTEIHVYTDSLKKVIVSKNNVFLSDSLILKKSGKYYVINQLDEGGWGIVNIVKKEKNGDIVFYTPNRFPFFGERQNLKVDKILTKKDSLINNIGSLKNIKITDSAEIRYAHYTGRLKTRDIKKITLPKNIQTILKKDGSIIYPN